MRSLKRNQQKLYYATYDNRIPLYDENHDFTGEYTTGYSKPVVFYANISPARGDSSDEVFGKSLDYTKSIVTCQKDLPIDEYSRIWMETEPVVNEDGTADGDSADYAVVQVARSLNSVSYAVKRLAKSSGV